MTIFDITIFWLHIAPSYYWLMYALWFGLWYYIVNKRWLIKWELLDSLLFYVFMWVILGWRLWYILFYNLNYYIDNYLDILKVWEWWMSFHGWVIWVVIAMILFARKNSISFYKVADEVCAILPIWIWFGRIWNYINKELLWFSPYNWWFAVEQNNIYYFPSPLLEALLEWLVLYIILNYFYHKKRSDWQLASLFLIFYWIFRLLVEIFFRMPDSHIWYIFKYFTMWEILTIPMIIIWILFYIKLDNKKNNVL